MVAMDACRPTNRTPTQRPGCRAPTPTTWLARRLRKTCRCPASWVRNPLCAKATARNAAVINGQHESPTSTKAAHPAASRSRFAACTRCRRRADASADPRDVPGSTVPHNHCRGDPRQGGHHWWLRRRCSSCPPGNWIIKPPGLEQPLPQAYGGSARIGRPAAGPDARLVGSHAATTCVAGGGPATVPTPHRRRRHSCG
jgi:hypothetical protein